jgi:hypothetical protein
MPHSSANGILCPCQKILKYLRSSLVINIPYSCLAPLLDSCLEIKSYCYAIGFRFIFWLVYIVFWNPVLREERPIRIIDVPIDKERFDR